MPHNITRVTKDYNFEEIFYMKAYNYFKAYVAVLVFLFSWSFYTNLSQMSTFKTDLPCILNRLVFIRSVGVENHGKEFRKQK